MGAERKSRETLPAQVEDDAKVRFSSWEHEDPFPEIPAALLNSADIWNYACATGMIHPFALDRCKSSSYSIGIGSTVIYWTDKGKRKELTLSAGETFTLHPNSIAFITTKEVFRLPAYMAMRFNLKINNVHRGILLGTGPLVDPGFEGPLLIPLHNLTNNPYSFQENETFVWAEFTKISPNELWDKTNTRAYSSLGFEGKYVSFPKNKKNRTTGAYLDEAFKGPIRSSIPDSIRSAESSAKRAQAFAGAYTIGGIATFLGLLLTLYYWATGQLLQLKGEINAAEKITLGVQRDLAEARGRIDSSISALFVENVSIRQSVARQADARIEELVRELARQKERIEELQRELQKPKQ